MGNTDLDEATLIMKYHQLAEKLLSGEISAEQFANEQTEIHLRLMKLADHDGLTTNFLNNQGFMDALSRELQVIKRFEYAGTLMALDIDHLKQFNDELGHPEGDKLIKLYAAQIEIHSRASDIKGRLGGDEFAVFLIGADGEQAMVVAERIRTGIIEEVKKEFPNLIWDQTVSIGLSQTQKEDIADSLRQRTDQALYEAKKERNKVVVK